MLAFSFFALIFSSLLWLIFSLRFIMENLAGTALFATSLVNIISYATLVCLPIFLMWMVFSYVNQYLQNRNVNTSLQKLFIQMKKNQDYSDLVARVLIETEQQIKNGFVLSKFDLLVADMNELLSEIIRFCNIASNEQIEHLWAKVQNGGKWSFGKVIIEVNNAQENFAVRVYDKACHDVVLAGTLMEFCARYLTLVSLLEKHDSEKVFLNIIETGVMGKVFSIFAPISDGVRKNRDNNDGFRPSAKKEEPLKASEFRAPQTPHLTISEEPKKSILGKIFQKKETNLSAQATGIRPQERDPFSMALERSFGTPAMEEPTLSMVDKEEIIIGSPIISNESFLSASSDEPKFEISSPQIEQEDEVRMSDTQKTLDSLKKEWAEIKIQNEPIVSSSFAKENKDDEENFAYPFGGWVDEQNYK